MQLKVYPLVTRRTQLCMRRKKTSYGNLYNYKPRSNLVKRLARQLGMTETQIRDQIAEERKYLLSNLWLPLKPK